MKRFVEWWTLHRPTRKIDMNHTASFWLSSTMPTPPPEEWDPTQIGENLEKTNPHERGNLTTTDAYLTLGGGHAIRWNRKLCENSAMVFDTAIFWVYGGDVQKIPGRTTKKSPDSKLIAYIQIKSQWLTHDKQKSSSLGRTNRGRNRTKKEMAMKNTRAISNITKYKQNKKIRAHMNNKKLLKQIWTKWMSKVGGEICTRSGTQDYVGLCRIMCSNIYYYWYFSHLYALVL